MTHLLSYLVTVVDFHRSGPVPPNLSLHPHNPIDSETDFSAFLDWTPFVTIHPLIVRKGVQIEEQMGCWEDILGGLPLPDARQFVRDIRIEDWNYFFVAYEGISWQISFSLRKAVSISEFGCCIWPSVFSWTLSCFHRTDAPRIIHRNGSALDPPSTSCKHYSRPYFSFFWNKTKMCVAKLQLINRIKSTNLLVPSKTTTHCRRQIECRYSPPSRLDPVGQYLPRAGLSVLLIMETIAVCPDPVDAVCAVWRYQM